MKKANRKPKAPAKEIKDYSKLIDYSKIKCLRFEYFDDRYYKAYFSKEIPAEYFKDIPDNLIYYEEDAIVVYHPSVTTILGETLVNKQLGIWRGNIGNREADRRSEEGKQRGDHVHNAIEYINRKQAVIWQNAKLNNITDKQIRAFERKHKVKAYVIKTQDEMNMVARYNRLLDVLKPKMIGIEEKVFNTFEYCYAGTVDSVWEFEKEVKIKIGRTEIIIKPGIYIVDYKTNNFFDDTASSLQIAAYYKAYPFPEKLAGYLIIHLNADIKSGIEGLKIYTDKMRLEKDGISIEDDYKQFIRLNETYKFLNKKDKPKNYEIPMVIYRGELGKRKKRKKVTKKQGNKGTKKGGKRKKEC